MIRFARKSLCILVLCILALLFAGAGCSKEAKKEKAEEAKGIAVQIVEPRFEEERESLVFPGSTDSPLITRVGFMLSGQVEELRVEVGQKVKAGEILGRIDDRLYRDNLTSAKSQAASYQGQVDIARANLNKALAGSRKQDVEMAKSSMLQAKAQFDHAKRELKRYEAVYKQDAISRQQYESVVTQYNTSRAQYKSAKAQYSLALEGTRKEDIDVARANLRAAHSSATSAQSQIDSAKTQLSYTIMKSPISGVVTAKNVEEGMVVNAGTVVYEIRSQKGTDMVIMVPSVHIENLYVGKEADVIFTEYPDRVIKGKVREINPASHPQTRSFPVKVEIESTPYLKNYSGVIGKVVFYLEEPRRGAYIPMACLMKKEDGKGYYVFTIDKSNTASKVYVEVDSLKDGNAMIISDDLKDVRIVLSGQEYLKDGSKVRIVQALNSQKFVSPNRQERPEKLKTLR